VKLVIATQNQGKAREIRTLLGDIPFQLLSLNDYDVSETAEEPESTYEGNAIAKARFYASATGELVIADDSGLEVAALNGAPGVFSARYSGAGASDQQRRQRLLSELTGIEPENRGAQFVCAVAVANGNKEVLEVTRGICQGKILFEERGKGGFGYDPLFVPEGFKETFGELSDAIKNQISHRAKAIHAMREFLCAKTGCA